MNLSQLFQKTSKYSDSTNFEMFNHLFFLFQEWLFNRKEIIILTDQDTLQYEFYNFLLISEYSDTNDNDSLNDYILMKYSEDIIDMFINFRRITQSYGSQILHEKNRTANQLSCFIHRFTEYYDDKENIEEEYNKEHVFIDSYEEFY
tara:strand:- start:1751 stop:2191 length:441 start_codon:yes stop_codon:yes gene_type:complete